MSRFHAVLIVGLAASLGGQAGQIQIGGSNGLTLAYFNSPNTDAAQSVCSASNPCVTGVGQSGSGQWGERSYINSLFESAATMTPSASNVNTLGTETSATSFTPGTVAWNDPSQSVTFDLLNDGSAKSGSTFYANNIWASSTAANQNALTVPVGVLGVDDAWLLLSDYYGYAGANPTITFNFSSAASNGAIDNSYVVTVPDTVTTPGGSVANGAISSAVECTNAGTGTCPSVTGNGHTIAASDPITGTNHVTAGTVLNPTGSNTSGSTTITTSTVWSGTYAGTTGAGVPYNGTTGNLMLNNLGFNLTSFDAEYLVDIVITPSSANSTLNSRLALSAITVDSIDFTAAPEPGTLVLFGIGIALVGFARFARNKQNQSA